MTSIVSNSGLGYGHFTSQKLRSRASEKSPSPAKHFEPNVRAAFVNKGECPGCREGQVNDDAVGARARRGTPIQNLYPHRMAIRQIGDANQRSERIDGMSRNHRMIVEPHTARSHLPIERTPVIRGEPFSDLERAHRAGLHRRWVRPRGAPSDRQGQNGKRDSRSPSQNGPENLESRAPNWATITRNDFLTS